MSQVTGNGRYLYISRARRALVLARVGTVTSRYLPAGRREASA